MKDKKQIRFVCLLMLCAMLTGIVQPAAADVKAERILKRMEKLTQIPNTHLLLAQDSNNHLWGVYDTDANVIIPLEYEAMSYLSYGYLSVSGGPQQEEPAEEAETEAPAAEDQIEAEVTEEAVQTEAEAPEEQVETEEAAEETEAEEPQEAAETAEKEEKPLDPINNSALLTLDGVVRTAYTYGAFKAYSQEWSAGWILEEGTAEDNDYTPDKQNYYRIARCDIFFWDGDQTFRRVASLTRDEFKDAKAHGEYLSVQNGDGGITVYSKNAEIVDIGAKNLNTSVYGIKNWMLVNLATGEMLMDGCFQVSEAQTESELLLIVTRIDLQGRKHNALVTTNGDIVVPMFNGAISSVSMGYAIITSNDTGKKGLYSYSEKRMILPCDYDEILENNTATDRFNAHGYITVKQDDQYYWYEVETRELTPVPEFETESKINHYGPVFYTSKKVASTTTTQFVSPSGTKKSILGTITTSRGSGYLMIANYSYGTTVINWDGNNYLPQYYSSIIITDDDQIILETKNSGYELYKLPE